MSALGSSVVGERLVALHMTWGAVNEWTTQAGYVRLAQRAGHPVLTELVRRIARQEGRHIDFYAAEARRRLADSRAARRLVRWSLAHLWRPVGSGVMPQVETDFVIRHLYGGADGAPYVERIDRRIDALPGLQGLRLITGAVGVRTATAPRTSPGRHRARSGGRLDTGCAGTGARPGARRRWPRPGGDRRTPDAGRFRRSAESGRRSHRDQPVGQARPVVRRP